MRKSLINGLNWMVDRLHGRETMSCRLIMNVDVEDKATGAVVPVRIEAMTAEKDRAEIIRAVYLMGDPMYLQQMADRLGVQITGGLS